MERLHLPLSPGLRVLSAGLFVSPGYGIHPDRVIDSYEIIFVRSGRLGIAEGEQAYEVREGEALWMRPGVRHYGTRRHEDDLSFYWAHFYLPKGGRKKAGAGIEQYSRPARPERVGEWFHRLVELLESGAPEAEEASLLLLLLWRELARVQAPENPNAGEALAARAEQFIATRFPQGVHAGDVAKAMGCHPDYLGRVFRRAHGCTVSEAIHRRQLQEARWRLREGGQSIEEVAFACGFREPRYFRKLFTAAQGVSPREYRKLHARIRVNTR
jgi:AraC-like DNA-binding protein